MKTFIALSLLISSSLFASDTICIPQNNLSIPHTLNSATGITESEFNEVLDELDVIYRPFFTAAGGILNIERLWKSKEVNAYARQFEHNDWRITFMGGMARHKNMTRDGFSLIVCHEIGHHLGGSPTYGGDVDWAANEGQSDYYATAKCLRRLWEKADNESAIAGKEIPAALRAGCESQWKSRADVHLCLRSGIASKAIGDLFADITTSWSSDARRPPKFETPDLKETSYTIGSHPKAQCRLDTYFQGSLCQIPFEQEFDRNDQTIGACHPRHQDKIGNRPLCWYKPST